MAAVTQITRQQGVRGLTRAYTATDALTLTSTDGGSLIVVSYAQLTGNMTINLTALNLLQFQEVVFLFSADASPRTVTFGTGFIASGTVVVTATKDAVARGVFDGTNIRITNREIGA